VKRIPLIMAVGALLLVLSAGVALAHLNEFYCNDKNPDTPLCPGTDERDHIIGSINFPGTDDIYADDNDSDNRGSADVVQGRDDDDIIRGQEGNDHLAGGPDDDTLYGNSGHDLIIDSESTGDEDVAYGSAGDDNIDVKDGDGDDWVSCGKGRDRVWFDSGDVIRGNCERKNPSADPPEFNAGDTTATASAAGLQYGETPGEQTEAQ
jgi:Ca2+-binding RTX toxin-like protein